MSSAWCQSFAHSQMREESAPESRSADLAPGEPHLPGRRYSRASPESGKKSREPPPRRHAPASLTAGLPGGDPRWPPRLTHRRVASTSANFSRLAGGGSRKRKPPTHPPHGRMNCAYATRVQGQSLYVRLRNTDAALYRNPGASTALPRGPRRQQEGGAGRSAARTRGRGAGAEHGVQGQRWPTNVRIWRNCRESNGKNCSHLQAGAAPSQSQTRWREWRSAPSQRCPGRSSRARRRDRTGEAPHRPRTRHRDRTGEAPHRPPARHRNRTGEAPHRPRARHRDRTGEAPHRPPARYRDRTGEAPRRPPARRRGRAGEAPHRPRARHRDRPCESPHRPRARHRGRAGEAPHRPRARHRDRTGEAPHRPRARRRKRTVAALHSPRARRQNQNQMGKAPHRPRAGCRDQTGRTPQ